MVAARDEAIDTSSRGEEIYMALLRLSVLGAVAWVPLVLGCASVLGIEDATCDAAFDARCGAVASPLQPAGAAPPMGGLGGMPSSPIGSAAGGVGAELPPGAGGAPAGAAGTLPASPEEAPSEASVPEPSLCERYCSTVAGACTGEHEQYASAMACLNVCSLLEAGEPGLTGNTVECRLARAELARDTGEPGNYCHSAGPGGAGVCGEDCEGFCAIMAQTCTLLGSFEQCLPQCEEVPNLAQASEAITYSTTVQDGDSVQCRLFHVTAATLDPVFHCAHAAGVAICAPEALDEQ